MANARTYRVDPNVFLQSAEAGTAQSPSDRTAASWAKILADVNMGGASYELLDTTATSLDLSVAESRLAVSGTMAFTLPNGTYVGQKHTVRAVSAASTPLATLTVTTPETNAPYVCASTFVFDTTGQSRTFEWTENSKWKCVACVRAGGVADGVVVGTTVLTGLNNWATYFLSVTGTVASTSTKAIPNGSCIGEEILVACSTAATTPHGDILITCLNLLGAAKVGLDDFTAVTDHLVFRWTGAAWQLKTTVTTAVTLV